MVDKSELLRVPAFAGLPDDQIAWFLGNSQELRLAPATSMRTKVIRRTRCLFFSKANFSGGENLAEKPLCLPATRVKLLEYYLSPE